MRIEETFCVTVTKDDGQKLGLDVTEDLCVKSIEGGLVADWNASSSSDCVQAGDRITQINGRDVSKFGEMAEAVKDGGELKIVVARPGEVDKPSTVQSAPMPAETALVQAQEEPQGVMEVQRKFMNQYGEQLEQLLSVAVYLVPIQDEEDDVAGFWSQAVYSIIDLFGLYRTVILRNPDAVPVAPLSKAKALGPGLPELAPRELLAESRRRYTIAAFALRSIRAVQVLIEMRALKFRGPQRALRVCFQVEVIKLGLKLFLRSLMPFSFYVDEEALEEVEPPQGRKNPFGLPQPAAPAQPSPQPSPVQLQAPVQGSGEVYVGSRTGKQLRPIASRASSSPAVGAEAPRGGAPSLVGLNDDRSDATPQMAVAEAVYHARPLVHLWLLMRRGQKSWFAWTVALFMDYISHGLLAMQVQPRPKTRAAALEVAELNRRRSALMWAFARNPFFERWLESHAVRLDNFIKRIPVLNIFNVVELFVVLRPLYFYTSAS